MKKAERDAEIAEMVMYGSAGVAVAYLARKYGCSAGKYYYWKKKLAGKDPPATACPEHRDTGEPVTCLIAFD